MEEIKETVAEATALARDDEYWKNYVPGECCQKPTDVVESTSNDL